MVKYFVRSSILIFIFALIVSCDNNNDGNDNNNPPLANVTFFNNSSYSVDIFYNFNPQFFDSSSYVGTVDTISRSLLVSVPASTDNLIGDTFYLRYKILLADSFETGTTDLHIHAERTMSNITFVLEGGKSYNKTIENPPVSELSFVNGIIKVQNLTTEQIWIENNGVLLPQKNRETAWITIGQTGYYEVALPFLNESQSMDYLKTRDSQTNRVSFPSFIMERGKLYFFEIRNTGINAPVITNINPLVK